MKKVQLVLGSGGARGIAHIAIIEGLVKDGIEIEAIYGCSMGAVIGGIFAAGHLEEYKEWLLSLSKNDVFELMDFTLTKKGFIKGDKIFDKHREMTGELLIEEFDIPFTAVALDIKSGKEIYFTKGDLYQALRGSVAIPGFIIPHRTESYVLIDGGVTNPLPLNLAVRKEERVVLAIDLIGPKDPLFILKEVNNEEKNPIPHWFERIIPSYLQ
jgi:NTE family protein